MTEAVFDHEDIYDAEIFPLMKRILEVCHKHGIPMVASFCYGRQADGEEFHATSAMTQRNATMDILAQLAQRGIRDGESVRIGSGAVAMTVTPDAPEKCPVCGRVTGGTDVSARSDHATGCRLGS